MDTIHKKITINNGDEVATWLNNSGGINRQHKDKLQNDTRNADRERWRKRAKQYQSEFYLQPEHNIAAIVACKFKQRIGNKQPRRIENQVHTVVKLKLASAFAWYSPERAKQASNMHTVLLANGLCINFGQELSAKFRQEIKLSY